MDEISRYGEKVTILYMNILGQTYKLYVRALAPGQIIYDGEATAVSSQNSDGKFDILAMHANFITIVENHPIVITKVGGEKITIQVGQAIVYNKDNKVSIYTDPKSGVNR